MKVILEMTNKEYLDLMNRPTWDDFNALKNKNNALSNKLEGIKKQIYKFESMIVGDPATNNVDEYNYCIKTILNSINY